MPLGDSKPRDLVIRLDRRTARFIDQERSRLRDVTGKTLSPQEFIMLLLKAHHAKWTILATHDPDSVPWMYRMLAEDDG